VDRLVHVDRVIEVEVPVLVPEVRIVDRRIEVPVCHERVVQVPVEPGGPPEPRVSAFPAVVILSKLRLSHIFVPHPFPSCFVIPTKAALCFVDLHCCFACFYVFEQLPERSESVPRASVLIRPSLAFRETTLPPTSHRPPGGKVVREEKIHVVERRVEVPVTHTAFDRDALGRSGTRGVAPPFLPPS